MYHLINNKNNKGFSLIELLVGMAIVVTATTVILTIIISAFRISSKSAIADAARQNGNYAMNRMVRMIQFADGYNGGNNGSNGAVSSGTFLNGLSDCNGDEYGAISIDYEGEERTLQCRTNPDASIYIIKDRDPTVDPSKRERLIDSRNLEVVNCKFVCRKVSDSASPVITISFDLSMGDGSTAVEKMTSIPFRTSVKMRNE